MRKIKLRKIKEKVISSSKREITTCGSFLKKADFEIGLHSTLVIVRETYFGKTATIERSVILKFYKANSYGSQYSDAFFRLRDRHKKLLDKLGKTILCKALEFNKKKCDKIF